MKTKIRKKDHPAIIICNKNSDSVGSKQSAENQNIKYYNLLANI